MPKSYRPLFLVALLLCVTVIAIEVARALAHGRGMDETTLTTALLFSVGMFWCLRQASGEARGRG